MAYNTDHYAMHTPRDRGLRASDRDRDAWGDFLRRQHIAGRLDTDEFADRYGRCLQAETCAELDELIVDLPTEGDPTFAAERVQARRGTRPDRVWEGGPRRAGGHPWPLPIFALLAVVLALALVSGAHVAWVALPLLFFFVVRPLMLRSMWRGGSRGWGPWACHSRFAGPGTTNP